MSDGIKFFIKNAVVQLLDDAISIIEAVDVHVESVLDSGRLTLLDFRNKLSN